MDKLEWKVTQLSYAYGKKVGLYLQNLAYSGEKNLFLIGEKGAGKSTFTKIMLGLYRDYQGSFLCNGVELKGISEESLINGYAYLPQDFPILDLTIRENFQLAAPGKEDCFYEDYLKKANLFETVMALPEGMDTKVSAQSISTGQRQRLALCGILMRDTAYVVLDEPVSAMDPDGARSLYKLVDKIHKQYGTTIIAVEHRVDYVLPYVTDMIVLNEGELVAADAFEAAAPKMYENPDSIL